MTSAGAADTPADTPADLLADLPASTRLAWWGTAWLRGHIGPDDLLDAVRAGDAAHVVAWPDAAAAEGLLTALGSLRAGGADGFGAAFPAEGDPVGLGGPPGTTRAALAAGEAVIVLGWRTEPGVALVPVPVGAATTWHAHPARRRQPLDLGEADRTLRRVLLESADGLAALDVARWRPQVADELSNLRHRRALPAPPGVPPRCVDLAGRALQALAIVDLALDDDGGAVSLGELERRRLLLRGLERAGRHALVAACSPEGWPPG